MITLEEIIKDSVKEDMEYNQKIDRFIKEYVSPEGKEKQKKDKRWRHFILNSQWIDNDWVLESTTELDN